MQCGQKAVKDAYHVICRGCAAKDGKCEKCLESRTLDGQKAAIRAAKDGAAAVGTASGNNASVQVEKPSGSSEYDSELEESDDLGSFDDEDEFVEDEDSLEDDDEFDDDEDNDDE